MLARTFRKQRTAQRKQREATDHYHPPLTKLLPVHSTPVVTTTLHEFPLAQVILVLVLTLKLPPLGTSGVLVVVITQT